MPAKAPGRPRHDHGRARNRSRALGRPSAAATIRSIARRSPISSSARASIATSSRGAGFDSPASVGGLDGIARAAVHREGRTAPLAEPRRADRHASHRLARRDRAHLFDQRHDGNAELHPADRRPISKSGCARRRAATRLPASRAASASSRPTTPARSSPARRSTPSRGSAFVIFPSARAIPSG